MTEMDISLVVFVLLHIFKFYKAQENCQIQHCIRCLTPQKCSTCEFGRFGQKCEYKCQANSNICALCRDLYLKTNYTDEVCFDCQGNEYFLNGACVPNCHEQYQGANCREACPKNCLQCTAHDLCTSCKNGWSGKACQCSTNCKQTGNGDEWCSEDGVCLKGCKRGKRGERCELECLNKEHCPFCNQSGHCLDCSEGWYGSLCNQTCGHCQPNKDGLTTCNSSTGECNDTCVDGYYGPSCEKRCGQCLSNEIRRDLTNSTNCDKISGNCSFGCKKGWFGDTCKDICSINCLNGTCYQFSGQCSDGCVRGWHGDFCEKKCNRTCANGTCDAFSSFCNEGCVFGWYGSTCNEMCNVACVNMSCDQKSGYCDYGCYSGWYGSTCNKICNAACVNASCAQDSGYCDYGCVARWYGEKCKYSCSKNCKEDICDRQTAMCSFGCNTYFKGPFCNDTETLEILVTPVFIKVIIGTAGCILLVACVLRALHLVRRAIQRKRVHRHNKATVESTMPVYDEIDDSILDDTVIGKKYKEKFRRDCDISLEQISYKRTEDCETGIYDLPTETRSYEYESMTETNFDVPARTFKTQALEIHTTLFNSSNSGYKVPLSAKDLDTARSSNYFTGNSEIKESSECHIFGCSEKLSDGTNDLCNNSRKSQAYEYMEFWSDESAKVKGIQSTSQRNSNELKNQEATTCNIFGERNSCTYLHPIS